MRGIVATAAMVILVGCASTGVQVSQEAATQFKEGVSTEAEIVKVLGPPTSVTIASQRKSISYTGLQYRMKGATFIPIVGVFAGGADYTMATATYDIRPDGVLDKVTYSTSSGSSRAGATPASMPATEPRAVK